MEYETICSFETLYAAYLRARRGKRKKLRTQRFEANALESLYEIAEQLKDGSYRPGAFEHFKVYEPKERDIEAPAFEDKVVLHAVTDNGLYDAITSRFIRNNCSNQKGKGTADAVIRLKQCFVRYYARYKTTSGWVLKCDIRHFFASIDHNVAKAKLLAVCEKHGIDPRIYELLCRYIDNSPQGLPLGYQTSQLLALLMLDALDHAVTETLGFPLYVRGMDDFVVIAHNKQDLQTLLREIRRLTGSIGLELNEKTAIFPLENGVDFLGFHTYFTKADRQKGVTGTNLLVMLESRLDNVVYRLGFANSRNQARQLVRHGIFTLNGRKVNIPSLQVRVGDTVEVPEKNRKIPVIAEAQEVLARRGCPTWLEADGAAFKGTVKALPQRDDIQFPVNEQLIVELYSK